jgi:hypothetical protein
VERTVGEKIQQQKTVACHHVHHQCGVCGVNGLNVQLHVAHINRYGPETVLILNHRMGNLHVQGLGMKQRTVNQLDHALVNKLLQVSVSFYAMCMA